MDKEYMQPFAVKSLQDLGEAQDVLSPFARELLTTVQNESYYADRLGIDWLAILLHSTFQRVLNAAHELGLNVVEDGDLCYISV